MSQNYLTRDGDVLDQICFEYYGNTIGMVEAVLAANPHLADLGPIYQVGTTITLPDLADPPKTATVIKLWN